LSVGDYACALALHVLEVVHVWLEEMLPEAGA
jgi:hypothetical protein